jgi:SAM-dependent methyltransferase
MSFSPRDREIWERLFDAVPGEWKAAPPSSAMVACLDFLRGSGARTVWDLGCGIGRWAIFLGRAGLSVSGSDFSRRAVRFASRWSAEEGLDQRFVECPVTCNPFPGSRFDAVVAALVLDIVPREEMRQALGHVRAALVEGGIVFALFNPYGSGKSGCASGSGNPTDGITSVSYSDDEVAACFEGFSVLDVRRFEQETRGFFLRRSAGAKSGTEAQPQ